jgi:hypothetical protein
MIDWLGRVVDYRQPGSMAARLRGRRMNQFLGLLRSLPRPVSILDIGGHESFWLTSGLVGDPDYSITLLNLFAAQVSHPNMTGVSGDARRLEYADKSFDVVFSNSVIEHVGTAADQQAMAREVRRVGKAYFIQTPNRYFPIEPHFVFPGFQFLPEGLRAGLHARFRLGWIPKANSAAEAREFVRGIRLISRREMASMFPDATIRPERFAGLVKSWMATGGW